MERRRSHFCRRPALVHPIIPSHLGRERAISNWDYGRTALNLGARFGGRRGKRWNVPPRREDEREKMAHAPHELIPDNEDYIRAVSEMLGHKKMGARVYGINSLCLPETSNDIRRRAAHVISVAGEMPPKNRDRHLRSLLRHCGLRNIFKCSETEAA